MSTNLIKILNRTRKVIVRDNRATDYFKFDKRVVFGIEFRFSTIAPKGAHLPLRVLHSIIGYSIVDLSTAARFLLKTTTNLKYV
jgi:hypothetical protein